MIIRQVISRRKFVEMLEQAIPIAPRLSPDSEMVRLTVEKTPILLNIGQRKGEVNLFVVIH